MERGAFLARVRQHLGAASTVELPESWPDTPASGRSADVETFQASLARSNGLALPVAEDELAGAVADLAREISARRVVVAPDADRYQEHIDRGLADAGADVLRPTGSDWRTAAAG